MLVTVICLCYNHSRFVREALESVWAQTYPYVQLIVVDDASTDGSADTICDILKDHTEVEFIGLSENVGNCKAFNLGLEKAKGDFVIDLAADDILLPHRIAIGVEELERAGKNYGVHFSDAEFVDERGKHLRFQSEKFPHDTIPQGFIYEQLIDTYFICPPTMLFRREVIDTLNGYDETLTYEDFDFWIRSSRNWQYLYSKEMLVQKRVLPNSHSSKQFRVWSRHSRSTLAVCEKIALLNRTKGEQFALSRRILYELGINIKQLNFFLMGRYCMLWLKNKKISHLG